MEHRLHVFLAIVREAGGGVVPPLDVNAALNFDNCPALDVGKIGAPFAERVKHKFPQERGAAASFPEE